MEVQREMIEKLSRKELAGKCSSNFELHKYFV